MIKLREVTEWKSNTPNHTYLLDDKKDRLLGYIKSGESEVIMFGKPLPFYRKYRKFKEIK